MNTQLAPASFRHSIRNIAVVGGGAWGTALAITASRAGLPVILWAREPEVVQSICDTHQNHLFLPGYALPKEVRAEGDLAVAVADADAVLLVVPSQFLRGTCQRLAGLLKPGAAVVICCKGIERKSGLLLASVVEEALPGHPIAVLSGPTFADEVAAGQPTAVTIASADVAFAQGASLAAQLTEALGTRVFRPYVSDDVIGVEVGGAVKNVLAVASGISTGLGFGSNARAAIITRGLDELKTLSEAMGGRRDTVTGLAGIGDLTLTCSSEQSRNMRFGKGLAQGKAHAEIFDGRPVVVEGAENAVSVTDLARRLHIEMPICEAVRSIIVDGRAIPNVMEELLSRPFRGEPKSVDIIIPQQTEPSSANEEVQLA